MFLRTIALLVLALLISDDGPKHGRRGNSLYEEKKYEAAAEQYRLGLSSIERVEPGKTHFGLRHNLGATLHRAEDFESARKSFDEAIAVAPSERDYAKASYNAGNNAFALQELEAALDYYRKSLLANPENEDAKFNYEFTKRKLEQQQQQSGDQSGDNQQQDQQNQSGENPENQNGNQEEQNQEQSDQPTESDQQNEPAPPQSQQEQPDPEQLSKEEAERILQALQNEEQDLLREMQRIKTPPRRVEKDW